MSSSGMVSDTSVVLGYSPDFIALLAAAICATGTFLIGGFHPGSHYRKSHLNIGKPESRNDLIEKSVRESDAQFRRSGRFDLVGSNSQMERNSLPIQVLAVISSCIGTYLVVILLTRSSSISISIALLATAIPFVVNRNREKEQIRQRENSWPEAIDSLVSALQSGIPIPEAVFSLSGRGPKTLQPIFNRIQRKLMAGEEFSLVLLQEKERANSAISDQVFETLILARDFGGKDSNTALRLLAEFVREDLAVAEEIRTKFSWVKNSAILATAAPWILLILLSTQSSTREAFATIAGVKVLTLGILMTASAYLWMEKVGALPSMPRALR